VMGLVVAPSAVAMVLLPTAVCRVDDPGAMLDG
jgi:hypothetical protein